MPIWLDALILGIVEGLSEFLPISSTGHLIIARHLFGMPDNDVFRSLDVVIQSGAVLAVLWHYRTLLLQMLSSKRQLLGTVIVAFLPAAILGFLFHSWIKARLFAPLPVTAALVVGGIAMIVIERFHKQDLHKTETLVPQKMTTQDALKIGFFQCLAMWPGTSRSMVTILGSRLLGFNSKTAAEFSFLLAIPTLMGATALDFYKHGREILSQPELVTAFALGIFAAFVVSLLVIRAFLKFLEKHSLEIFGWYRIVFGIFLFFLWS